jgi:hypothetical protein
MVNTFLVLIAFLFANLLFAKESDRVYNETLLGERKLDSYSGRYYPSVNLNMYSGRVTFVDDDFFENYFGPYMMSSQNEYLSFFKSEIGAAILCTNDQFSRHYDDLRYAFRLITLSYLIESQWHMNLMANKMGLTGACGFDVKKWAQTCRAKGPEMKKFVDRIQRYNSPYLERLPQNYDLATWNRELKAGFPIWYSQERLKEACKNGCVSKELTEKFKASCDEDQELMTTICSENDELYGLSNEKDAYYLLGRSNIINTFNKEGEALGCLRRFSEGMAHREAQYPVTKTLFPTLESFLIDRYQERFMQGRMFFFGSAKEFEEKGLAEIFTEEKKTQVPTAVVAIVPKAEVTKPETPKPIPKAEPNRQVVMVPEKKEVDVTLLKSAFLQAAEVRAIGNLDRVEVDMTKLRYDYVFSLNMTNLLSVKLKTFMTRDALSEMLTYDKLGSKEGPVPLLFIKFLIDFQEHQGLWNLISVLGDKFYVEDDIDTKFKTNPELVHILNNDSTQKQWQIVILKQ